MITQDFQTSYAELVKKSYHLHWFGGLIFTLIVTLLYYFISDFPLHQAVKGAVWINALFWGAKELIYGFINGVFSDREIVQKLKKFTIFGITPFGFGPAEVEQLGCTIEFVDILEGTLPRPRKPKN
jgi:hypothetical protein